VCRRQRSKCWTACRGQTHWTTRSDWRTSGTLSSVGSTSAVLPDFFDTFQVQRSSLLYTSVCLPVVQYSYVEYSYSIDYCLNSNIRVIDFSCVLNAYEEIIHGYFASSIALRSSVISVSVFFCFTICLSTLSKKTTRPNFTQFSVHAGTSRLPMRDRLHDRFRAVCRLTSCHILRKIKYCTFWEWDMYSLVCGRTNEIQWQCPCLGRQEAKPSWSLKVLVKRHLSLKIDNIGSKLHWVYSIVIPL